MGLKAGYKQTEVGAIPKDWEVKPLSEGITLLSGYHVLARHCNTDGDGIPYITGPADFPKGVIQHTKYTTSPKTICRANDILVTVKGSGAGTIVLSDAEYCISRQLMATRVNENWDTSYIYFSLLQSASLFNTAATGLIPGLSRSDILDKTLPIPPSFVEQTAIATALSDADALIQSLERLIAKKRDIKQGAMQELLTMKKRLPGFSGAWEVKQLGDLFDITSSKRVFQSEWRSEGIPFFRARELAMLSETGRVENELFITRELYDRHRRAYGVPEVGDMLVTGVGTLGKVYVVSDDREFYFKDGNIIWFRIGGKMSAEFLRQLYLTEAVLKQIFEGAAGTTVGTYTISAAKKTTIPFPPLLEQTAITTTLSDMDAEIAALDSKLAKARQIKEGMMQELLTGRIRLT